MTDIVSVSNAEEARALTGYYGVSRSLVKSALETVTENTKTGCGAAYHLPKSVAEAAVLLAIEELGRRGFRTEWIRPRDSVGGQFIRISW